MQSIWCFCLNLGIATFVFDETRIVYSFCRGNLTQEEFFSESGKAILRSGGSFAATYCAVAVSLTPSGPVVMFIAVGGYILADLAINKYEQWQDRKYLNIDDILWDLPFEVKNRITMLNLKDLSDSTLIGRDINSYNITILDKQENDQFDIIDRPACDNKKSILE